MLKQIFKFYPRRNFSKSITWKSSVKEVSNKESVPESMKKQTNTGSTQPHENTDTSPYMKMDFVPNEYEKVLLVLSGKYKSKNDIPPRIGYSTIETAKSKVRIKLSIILMIGTIGLCYFYIMKGKRRAERGETITSMEMERSRRLIEEDRKRKGL